MPAKFCNDLLCIFCSDTITSPDCVSIRSDQGKMMAVFKGYDLMAADIQYFERHVCFQSSRLNGVYLCTAYRLKTKQCVGGPQSIVQRTTLFKPEVWSSATRHRRSREAAHTVVRRRLVVVDHDG